MSQSFETSKFAIQPHICECNYYCKLKTSKTQDNLGFCFWRCKVLEDMGGCKHFRWEDSIHVDKTVAMKFQNSLFDRDTATSCISRDTATSRISRDTAKLDSQFKLVEAEEKIELLEVLLTGSQKKRISLKAKLRDTQHEKIALKEKLKLWKIICAILLLFIIYMYFVY
ncbi:uncharacterized protein LOC132068750 [Lycium ferocissimum]|uniref:uncharacterized protein LOC132068750 n=1 Tax=Lycium ferocissimum TaxID=112874 RepID=UPI0028149F99|nr:uncharacterized protein LOC132068750 [Lycium ferocissimum]